MPVKLWLKSALKIIDFTAITKLNQGAGSGLDSDLLDGLHGAAYEQIANKGAASGYASLDTGGKVPSAQLPALALTDIWTVASEAAQLALTAQEGDIAIRTDQNKSYAHNGGTAGTMADWSELLSPTAAVSSVFGRTGAVVAAINDYTWAQIDKTVSSLVDITTRSHTLLSDIGTNTHAQIDTHLGAVSPHSGHELIASKDQANGYPGLSAGSKIAGTQITYGSLVSTACEGNDTRLSDARTPTAHKAAHEVGGADLVNHDSLTGFDITKHRQEIIGALAARPAFGTADRFYFATDTKELFRDTGTAWDRLTTDWADVRNKSIVNAEVGAGAGIIESKLALNFATHSNANDPTADEKAALAGTNGAPSGTNKYLTNSDPRNSDTRTPTAHASTHNGGADPVTPSGIGAIAVPGSSAWGDILFRDTSGWTRLPAGTSGLFLKTLGVGADPVWASGAGGATTFLDLTDTPSAYTSQAKKLVRVNSGATALEFLNELDNLTLGSLLVTGAGVYPQSNIQGTAGDVGFRLKNQGTPGGTLDFSMKDTGIFVLTKSASTLGFSIDTVNNILALGGALPDDCVTIDILGYLRPVKVSLPTAGSAYRGKIVRVEGAAGVADVFYICEKGSDNNYYWQRLTAGAGDITRNCPNYSAIIQGTWVRFSSNASQTSGFFMYNSSNTDLDQVDYKISLEKGTYTFDLITMMNTNCPILDVLIDGVSAGTKDLYSASVVYNSLQTITGIVVTTSGLKTLSLKVNGKNASSTGYYLNLSYFTLFRTA